MTKTNSIFIIILVLILFHSVRAESTSNELVWVVPKSGLNLRKKPDVTSEKITVIPQLAVVTLLEKVAGPVTIDGIQGHWQKIKWQNFVGYAFDRYLSISSQNLAQSLMDTVFHQGIECTGRTHSEFTRRIVFTSQNDYKIIFEAPWDMMCIQEQLTTGKFSISGNTITLTPHKKIEISYSGPNCKKKTTVDKTTAMDRNDGGVKTLIACQGFLSLDDFVGRKAALK